MYWRLRTIRDYASFWYIVIFWYWRLRYRNCLVLRWRQRWGGCVETYYENELPTCIEHLCWELQMLSEGSHFYLSAWRVWSFVLSFEGHALSLCWRLKSHWGCHFVAQHWRCVEVTNIYHTNWYICCVEEAAWLLETAWMLKTSICIDICVDISYIYWYMLKLMPVD